MPSLSMEIDPLVYQFDTEVDDPRITIVERDLQNVGREAY